MRKAYFYLIVFILMLLLNTSNAALQSCDLLEAALTMLPKNHEIIKLYNTKVDGNLVAEYEGGVPYYFAGVNKNLILKTRYPMQESSYFKAERMYLYGFDCKGFTRWTYEMQNLKEHPKLTQISLDEENKLNLDGVKVADIYKHLNVGDLLITHYSTRHVLMYIGTLADYGVNETYGEISKYTIYPLVIHCGNNPFYYDYYKQYIKDKRLNAFPPDGGVTVSLLYLDKQLAPKHRLDVRKRDFAYFDLGNSIISVVDISKYNSAYWWRGDERINYSLY